MMIQSKIIAELMDIYEQAEKNYDEHNQCSLFYKCLKEKINSAASKNNNNKKEILEGYRIACQSYLDSNLLEFNISIAVLLLSIAGLLDLMKIEMTVGTKALFGIAVVVIVATVVVAYLGRQEHKKRRRLLEIHYVLEKDKGKKRKNN